MLFNDTFEVIKNCHPNNIEDGVKSKSFSEISKAFYGKNVQQWPLVNLQKWLKQVEEFHDQWFELQVIASEITCSHHINLLKLEINLYKTCKHER